MDRSEFLMRNPAIWRIPLHTQSSSLGDRGMQFSFPVKARACWRCWRRELHAWLPSNAPQRWLLSSQPIRLWRSWVGIRTYQVRCTPKFKSLQFGSHLSRGRSGEVTCQRWQSLFFRIPNQKGGRKLETVVCRVIISQLRELQVFKIHSRLQGCYRVSSTSQDFH